MLNRHKCRIDNRRSTRIYSTFKKKTSVATNTFMNILSLKLNKI